MLGPPSMVISIESSRFKSAFGQLEPVVKRAPPKTATNRRFHRKPVSFFDSQRIDPSQFYQTES